MRACVVTFPGSNCDRDLAVAFERVLGVAVRRVWHKETELERFDLIGVPGGFSYGDYLRPGAVAARSPVMREVARQAADGALVLGPCNGFQILTEAGLLPGALVRNQALRFVCRVVGLDVVSTASPFTAGLEAGARLHLPVAHHDGAYVIDDEGRRRLEGEDRIALRYADEVNGSTDAIAGVFGGPRNNVLGLMPHPERAIEPLLGSADGRRLLEPLAA